ncbi:MAG: M20/M25/M40 family metallo-hydrolase [Gemmatimonadetes bacterium]|nr:M20/M25/M40 family metallo-hydrolase [Gemmatimonadota bacterium]
MIVPSFVIATLLSGSPCPGCLPALSDGPAAEVRQENPHREEVRRLARHPRVSEAMRLIEAQDEATMADLIELTQIPAPPFMEEARGRRFLEKLRELGVDTAWVDEEGNVIARRRGRDGDRVVAVSGHLDTVFPEGTDVTVRQRGDTLFAPGVADDTRGLAAVLAILRAMNAADVETEADLLFIGTVGEEGLGDLRGMKHLFRDGGPRIDAFISIDGAGVGNIVHMALGSHRYRVTFRGPGGHSWGAFGLANPAHALGRSIQHFDVAADAFTSSGARTSYNVGVIGGGTSVNSIPFEAWMEVDMRSESQDRLVQVDSIFQTAMRRALEESNATRREGEPLELDVDLIGDRPSGEIPITDPFVQRTTAAALELGIEPDLGRSSTDSNIPISMGIPALTLDGGGVGGRAHSLDEWFINRNGPLGIQHALLTLLAQAGVTPVG